ncbi:MAG TPA: hypothetical protein VIU46_03235 [Gallionellaceae bacterium]
MLFFLLRTALPILLPSAVAWAERTAAASCVSGRPLSAGELALAREVGVHQPERIRLLIVDEMPRPQHLLLRAAARAAGFLGRGTTGLTLGHAVLVLRGHATVRLYSHEFRHVRQYEQAGSIAAFLREYFHQVLAHGYWRAPLEVDARRHEIVR